MLISEHHSDSTLEAKRSQMLDLPIVDISEF